MGLDWTAALLPNERPSWCTSSLAPSPPPSAFPLPPTTAAYVAVGKNGRAKRIARWTWEEPEWRVVVRKEGQEGVWRVEKTPPKDKDGNDETTGTAARMLRAAQRRRDSTSTSSSGPAESEGGGEQHSSDSLLDPASEDEAVTDPDGWLYGDNKWEGASSKGGMGKYTRFRRWTRIALLTETIELVGPGELGVVRDSAELDGYGTANSIFGSTPSVSANSPTLSSFSDSESQTAMTAPDLPKESKDGEGSRSMLKQRLKAVVEGTTH